MFERSGAGDLAVFGDVAHHDDGDCGLFGHTNQCGGDFADLSNAPGGAINQSGGEGLDRIDDDQVGRGGFDMSQDCSQIHLVGKQQGVLQTARSRRSKVNLAGRFLGTDVQNGVISCGYFRCHIQ